MANKRATALLIYRQIDTVRMELRGIESVGRFRYMPHRIPRLRGRIAETERVDRARLHVSTGAEAERAGLRRDVGDPGFGIDHDVLLDRRARSAGSGSWEER